ncbi:hypothetical protein [Paractinoplanes rishiriensis]|uniref:Uncharacterized protein n=1 Tax=Paractinoplanes rishiriensis TaxID=1050105 RepID=A0A919N2T7_9ACTN|nr:hypothetical protein [Actinoplanes rishiriensis]GIF01843.1 hypothetical protein Ari01nite_93070 [Actinoplanes rishiriensis]
MVDTVLPSEVLTKLPWDARSSREQYAHAMCCHHAPALLTMAAIILDDTDRACDDDTDRACDIVAAAICAAYGEGSEFDLGQMRVRLARSVYRRCLGHLAFTERYPQPDRPRRDLRPRTLFDDLTSSQRAILALVIFGSHDLAETAATVQRPADDVVDQIHQVAWRRDGD